MKDWTDLIDEPEEKPVEKKISSKKKPVKKQVQKKTPVKKQVKKKVIPKKQPEKSEPYKPKISPDLEKLIDDARMSELRVKITKEEEAKYKAETERLKMEKEAGKVAEFKFMDVLFFDFMDRTFQEIGKMTKKLYRKINDAVQAGETEKIVKIIDADISSTLKGIKRDQKKAVEEWADR